MRDVSIQHDFLCPLCLIDLTEVEHEGTTYDRCLHCNGIWLTGETLPAIMQHSPTAATPQLASALRGWWGGKVPSSQPRRGFLERLFGPR